MKAVRDLPVAGRRSITFDRGTEFVSWPHLQARLVAISLDLCGLLDFWDPRRIRGLVWRTPFLHQGHLLKQAGATRGRPPSWKDRSGPIRAQKVLTELLAYERKILRFWSR